MKRRLLNKWKSSVKSVWRRCWENILVLPPWVSHELKIDGPVPYCAKFAVPANDNSFGREWLKNLIEKRKWELAKVDGNVLKEETKTAKLDDRFSVYSSCCHGARMTQNQELSQLWSTSWDQHGSDLICIDRSLSKPLNLTSATFLNHSTHLDLKLHFKAVFWWFWWKFLAALKPFAYVNPKTQLWEHIYTHSISKKICSVGRTNFCTSLQILGFLHVIDHQWSKNFTEL